MTVPNHIAAAITRLVKPSGSKLSTRETIEAHADKLVSDHNRILKAMIAFLDTGERSTPQIKEWTASIDRGNATDVATMRGVLVAALVKAPAFQGLSDGQALETYGRLLLNLYNLEVLGQPALA
jgi:hypothetical protein